MRPDPFRIQILTLSLDSQTVLAIVGLVVAAFVFRQAARRVGLDLRSGHWWDLLVGSVIGARLLWIVTHADYYLRQPLQVVVIVDGGLHPLGHVLGVTYGIWRLSRSGDGPSWRLVADLVAVCVLVVLLFERAGCALTSCGAGPVSTVPWALLRGVEWREPVALEQVAVLSLALAVAVEALRVRGAAFAVAVVALALVELIAVMTARSSPQEVVALGAVLVIYVGTWLACAARDRLCVRRRLGEA